MVLPIVGVFLLTDGICPAEPAAEPAPLNAAGNALRVPPGLSSEPKGVVTA